MCMERSKSGVEKHFRKGEIILFLSSSPQFFPILHSQLLISPLSLSLSTPIEFLSHILSHSPSLNELEAKQSENDFDYDDDMEAENILRE